MLEDMQETYWEKTYKGLISYKMKISFVCLLPVCLLLSSMAVLCNITDYGWKGPNWEIRLGRRINDWLKYKIQKADFVSGSVHQHPSSRWISVWQKPSLDFAFGWDSLSRTHCKFPFAWIITSWPRFFKSCFFTFASCRSAFIFT